VRSVPHAEYVLKAEIPSNTPAFVTKGFGSGQPDIWISFDIGMDSSALAILDGAVTYVLACTDDAGPNEMFSCNTTTDMALDLEVGWQSVELHVTSTTVTGYLNGDQFGSHAVTGTGGGAKTLKLGFSRIVSSYYGSDRIAYYRAVKVGTERGGADLFSDDFSSGSFSQWDTNSGGVSIVPDPFFTSSMFGQPTPPTPKALSFTATDNGGGAVGDNAGLRLDSAESEVWVEFDLAMPLENTLFWDPNGSANFCTVCDDNVLLGGGSTLGAIGVVPDGSFAWNAFGGSSSDEATPGAGIFYDQWITCQLHVVKTGTTTVEFYADDTLYCTFTDAETSDVKDIILGQKSAPDDDGTKVIYMKNLKVGTTQHGFDLLSITEATLNAHAVGDAAAFLLAHGITGCTGFPQIVDDPYV
jgi:hypothetical protein